MPERELWHHYARALAFRRLGEIERITLETPPQFINEIKRMISGEDAAVGTLVANEVSREIGFQRELIVPSDENWIKYLRLLHVSVVIESLFEFHRNKKDRQRNLEPIRPSFTL